MRARAVHGSYLSITLVGHSFGAVLARKIAIVAYGEQAGADNDIPAPFEVELSALRQPRSWAPLIGRIVLMAGMNRGWSTSSAMDWFTSAKWSFMQVACEISMRGKPTILAIRRGAPFLVQTRLQWLAMMDPQYGPRPNLIVAQLLGTSDDHVSPDDNVDYSVDLYCNRDRQSYFYLEVPASNHPNVVEMSTFGPSATAVARAKRRDTFLTAFSADRAQLATASISRDQMADNLPPLPDPDVTDVVFVVHGIRDKGFWTQKVARTIKRQAAPGQKFESWTESYGYFAMMPFMLRAVRQRKVEWLMDRYVEARARYPRARMHFVGHSNGTYLGAQALQDYPSARFKRMVFAGSVVRCDYDWLDLIAPGPNSVNRRARVGQVLNYVATADWVVALFPNGVQPWRRFNLGSAGHDGFTQGHVDGPVHQVNYIVGGHGVGHEEENWKDIAQFVVNGVAPTLHHPQFSQAQSKLWRVMGSASAYLLPLFVCLVVAIGLLLFVSMFVAYELDAGLHPTTTSAALLHALYFAVYATAIRMLVTRF